MKTGNSLRFPAKMRLRLDRDFRRVYAGKQRVDLGFLTIYALPNALTHTRIGVSLPRKVGTAVRRNRIKRLLREGFRLWQKQLPTSLDVVIVVRPHEPKQLKEYQETLMGALRKLETRCMRLEPDQIQNRPKDDIA
jgi:ribonuclease P protein component